MLLFFVGFFCGVLFLHREHNDGTDKQRCSIKWIHDIVLTHSLHGEQEYYGQEGPVFDSIISRGAPWLFAPMIPLAVR